MLEFERVPAQRGVDMRAAVVVLVIGGVRKQGKERCSTFVNLVVLKTDPDRLPVHSIYLPRSVSIPRRARHGPFGFPVNRARP